MSDNLLVKTQALQTLNGINFPLKASLQVCGITNDVDGIGNSWQSNIDKQNEMVENAQNINENQEEDINLQ